MYPAKQGQDDDGHILVKSNTQKLSEINNGFHSADVVNENIIIGDNGGNISSYQITSEATPKLLLVEQTFLVKSKIEQIVSHPKKNLCYVLCNKDVYLTSVPRFKREEIIKKEDIMKILVNPYVKDYENLLLCITKKKKVKIYEIVKESYASDKYKCIEKDSFNKDLTVEEVPENCIWAGKFLVYFYGKKNTVWLDLYTGKTALSDNLENVISIVHFEKSKAGVSTPDFTLFLDEAKSCSFNMINHLTPPNFQTFSTYKTYLLGLHKNHLLLYSRGNNSYNISETHAFTGEGDGRIILTTQKYILILAKPVEDKNDKTVNVLFFKEKPYQVILKQLLDTQQFDNALIKLVENISEDSRQEQLENFFGDCVWACLNNKNNKDFEKAKSYIELVDFNPFEYIYIFYNMLSVNILHNDIEKEIKDNLNSNQAECIFNDLKKGLTFLTKILKDKRDYLLATYEFPKENSRIIKFKNSSRALIDLNKSTKEVTIQQTFLEMNKCILKCMIKNSAAPKEMMEVLDNKSINLDDFVNFEDDQFFKEENAKGTKLIDDKLEAKFVLAYLAEKRGLFKKALEEWKIFGEKKSVGDRYNYSLVALDRTKKIFYSFKESDKINTNLIGNNIISSNSFSSPINKVNEKASLIREYIKWILKKLPTEAFEVIINTEMITIKDFLEIVIPEVEKEVIKEDEEKGNTSIKELGYLKEQFLEYLNVNKANENYQTQLLELYIQKLFKFQKKSDLKPANIDANPEFKKIYEKFDQIIRSENSIFNKKAILDIIEASWLKEARILLYSQLKEHDKALRELFQDEIVEKKFVKIRKYCQDNIKNNPKIYQVYFKIISEHVKTEYYDEIEKDENEIMKIKDEYNKEVGLGRNTDKDKNNMETKITDINKEIKRLKNIKSIFEDEMMNILTEFGDIDKIDPFFVLQYTNENLIVYDGQIDDKNKKKNQFFDYLVRVIKDYTIINNKYKITKALSDMSLVYKEKEAFDFKKRSVTIDNERTCDLCKKKIGGSMFVIYPNMKVYHYNNKCAPNPNIDPTTGVDFSKMKILS